MKGVDVPAVMDDPHVIAVLQGLETKAFDDDRAVEILESCGYTKSEAIAAIAACRGEA